MAYTCRAWERKYGCVGRGMIHGYKRDENRRILRIKYTWDLCCTTPAPLTMGWMSMGKHFFTRPKQYWAGISLERGGGKLETSVAGKGSGGGLCNHVRQRRWLSKLGWGQTELYTHIIIVLVQYQKHRLHIKPSDGHKKWCKKDQRFRKELKEREKKRRSSM